MCFFIGRSSCTHLEIESDCSKTLGKVLSGTFYPKVKCDITVDDPANAPASAA